MNVQSVCRGLHAPPKLQFHDSSRNYALRSSTRFRNQVSQFRTTTTSFGSFEVKDVLERFLRNRVRREIVVSAAKSNSGADIKLPKVKGRVSGVEPFRGKSGSVSFYGLTHQLKEEAKLESAPFVEDKGSFLWILAPIALISSLILPQIFIGNRIEAFFKNETVVEMVTSLSFEALFYVGLAIFLFVTNHVQRPYLQYSAKRWSLITGLRGYLSSVFFTMGFKVIIPLFAVYIAWPVVGFPALVAVAPFLIGCLAQLAFEKSLEMTQSSCWPLVPIIFEVYRFYQLTKAAHFVERLMFAMKDLPRTPQTLDKSGALVAMIVTFQILGLLCLWSLITFLLRLFPSRPVSENY